MSSRNPLQSLKNRITSLFSWISLKDDGEESTFHPETVVYEKIFTRSSAWSKKRHLAAFITVLAFFGICTLLYAATIKGVAGNPSPSEMKQLNKSSSPFELSPERGRYAHTYALAENDSFSLTQELADVVYPDVGYVDGRFYSFFAPGISIIAVPFYLIGRSLGLAQVFTFSVISLFALGNLFVLYRIGRDIFKLPTANALFAPVLFGFGSTSWSYATTMYQHHLTTFFILSSFYAVWRYRKKTKFSFFWGAYIWFCYAAAFMVDYPNLLFMSPVMIYFFLSSVGWSKIRRNLTITFRPVFLITSIFFFALSFLHGYYNYTQFGDFKKLSGNIVGYKTIKEHQLLEKANSKEVIKEIADDKTAASFFSEENLTRGLQELLVAPDKGIFFFSPIFLLAIAGIAALVKHITMERAILLSIVCVNVFLYSSFGDPWGGWAFGPRYLILSMAVLSLFITLWISSVRYQLIAKFVAFFLFAFSSAISLLGVLTTNAVPPQVEADFIKSKYGYFLNWDFFRDGVSSSFVYNQFFASGMTLQQYFLLLYVIVLVLGAIILVSLKKVKQYEN